MMFGFMFYTKGNFDGLLISNKKYNFRPKKGEMQMMPKPTLKCLSSPVAFLKKCILNSNEILSNGY